MEFTVNSIISAINIAASPSNTNTTDIQNALSYINQWTYSENGVFLAMQILSDSNLQLTHKFYAASLIKIQLPKIWDKTQPEFQYNMKNHFLSILKSNALTNDNSLFKIIVDIIVNIALFEFPQKWPELGYICFKDLSDINDAIEKSHYYHFIGQFITAIDESKDITPARIQFLRNLFLDNLTILSLHIQACFSNENLVPDGLRIFNGFLKWGGRDQILPSISLIRNLCFQFIFNENMRPTALECLRTLFLRRSDSISFTMFAPIVVCALGSPTSVLPNGQHITSDPQILNFLLSFLSEYLHSLISVFDQMNKLPVLESMRQMLIEMQLSPQDLSQRILYILNVFLSIQNPELLTDEYWSFWSVLFNQIWIENRTTDPNSYRPTFSFIKDLIPSIRKSLFQFLPYDHYSDDSTDSSIENSIDSDYQEFVPFELFLQNKSKSAWSSLAGIDINGMIDFLKQQPPSVALCYGIGNLEFCRKSNFDISVLSTDLSEIYRMCQSGESNPELFVALLFCISHTLSLDKDGQNFVTFVEFALKCIVEENPPISTAATSALYYASSRCKKIFINEQYVTTICEYSEIYLKKLDHDNSVRMFKMMTSLISRLQNDELIRQLYGKISSLLVLAMDAFFDPEKVFDCIKEGSDHSGRMSQIFMSFLWPKLLEMTNKVIHSNQPSEILEKVIEADASGMKNESFNFDRFKLILSWMVEKNQVNIQNHLPIDDCFYNFISIVHTRHFEIDGLFVDIVRTFVEPAVSTGLINLTPIMQLLIGFSVQSLTLPFYVQLTVDSLRSLNYDDNVKGIDAANFFINTNSEYDNFVNIIKNNSLHSILSAVFSSLTDMMHKFYLFRFVHVVRNILTKASKNNILNLDIFTNLFLSAIKENVEEPAPGMFLNFLLALKNKMFEVGFPLLFTDFLILIRRMSPNDEEAFKDKQKQDAAIEFNIGVLPNNTN